MRPVPHKVALMRGIRSVLAGLVLAAGASGIRAETLQPFFGFTFGSGLITQVVDLNPFTPTIDTLSLSSTSNVAGQILSPGLILPPLSFYAVALVQEGADSTALLSVSLPPASSMPFLFDSVVAGNYYLLFGAVSAIPVGFYYGAVVSTPVGVVPEASTVLLGMLGLGAVAAGLLRRPQNRAVRTRSSGRAREWLRQGANDGC